MKVLIIDDHELFRKSLKSLLQKEYGTISVYEAASGSEAEQIILQEYFDIIILDFFLQDKDGLEVLLYIQDNCDNPKVLVLSIKPEDIDSIRMLRAGAKGYISKNCSKDDFLKAIEQVKSGNLYFSDYLAEMLLQNTEETENVPPHMYLSDREYQLVMLTGQGYTLTEISEALCLSVKTVSSYQSRVLKKLNLKNRYQLIKYVFEHNLL